MNLHYVGAQSPISSTLHELQQSTSIHIYDFCTLIFQTCNTIRRERLQIQAPRNPTPSTLCGSGVITADFSPEFFVEMARSAHSDSTTRFTRVGCSQTLIFKFPMFVAMAHAKSITRTANASRMYAIFLSYVLHRMERSWRTLVAEHR